MVTKREIYERAADIVEQGWTRRSYARDAYNQKVPAYSDRAEKFCAVGGIERACYDQGMTQQEMMELTRDGFYDPLKSVLSDTQPSVTIWNDVHALDAHDVANHLRKAAELCDE